MQQGFALDLSLLPAEERWVPMRIDGFPPPPVYGHTLTLLTGDRVLFFGGKHISIYSQRCTIYIFILAPLARVFIALSDYLMLHDPHSSRVCAQAAALEDIVVQRMSP